MKGNIMVLIFLVLPLMMSGCGQKKQEVIEDKHNIPQGSTLETIRMHSEKLNMDMNINVYLPQDYDMQEEYPVLYLLHGYSGNEGVLKQKHFKLEADKLISQDKIMPLIIVAPNMNNSYGINSSDTARTLGDDSSGTLNEGMYKDYLCHEVIPYIDTNYHTIDAKEGRYIGGISMGGFAALHIAFSQPDLFSKVGGHMPALFIDKFPYDLDKWLYPSDVLRKERDPIYMAKTADIANLKVYLDCGKDDSFEFYNGCAKLHKILLDKEIDVQYHLNDGEHDNEYIHGNVEKYLLFYSRK
ncbi:esterase [Vallitalea pronyensis]|uniref:Esterase n=1 Tax=Vallitalea pronyensis TaxID=1348613 RepID=A0A8J8ML99_9FIRM|nr:alpha/beta hydrolase-fold protein [Vallitalea pronyensis]QUI23775.1 esterase [Vallitalea pronyensis]